MLLNCDMGESFGVWKMGVDELLMPHINLANIACGGHASDPDVMSATLQLAKQHQVSVGAHPSYADIAGFGRRSIPYQTEQLSRLIVAQVGALAALADYHQVKLHYVKPHGALYNDMHQDLRIFEAVCKAVAGFKRPLKLMVHASQCAEPLLVIAQRHQLKLLKEAFCDRRYLANGQLQARSEPGAVLSEEQQVLAQVQQLLDCASVTCADGSELTLQADTLCVHGDNEVAVSTIQAIKQLISSQH
ncbi:5-oxoprolinase subunit PxpA [Agarivorans sp.]|uniref:5-oxoprolinase subunit PxpA n=1 Tax=Agarivorans sp. TaxID=1872412 RepID=UPI003CFF7B73